MSQQNLFPDLENEWEKEWKDMPEYNNINEPDAKITATFKFKTEQDYIDFLSLIKKHLYNGQKVFDGMQSKTKKQTWYPLKIKAKNFRYE